MAFALASRNTSTEHRQIMATTTEMLVIITVFINGGLTTWMIDFLRIKHGSMVHDESQAVVPLAENGSVDSSAGGTSPRPETVISGQNPWDKAFLPRKWYNFDASFMKPLLTHASPSLIETLPAVCTPLARLLTSSRQMAVYSYRDDDSVISIEREERIRNSNPFSRDRVV